MILGNFYKNLTVVRPMKSKEKQAPYQVCEIMMLVSLYQELTVVVPMKSKKKQAPYQV